MKGKKFTHANKKPKVHPIGIPKQPTPTFLRKEKSIQNLSDGSITTLPSINRAKKVSRELQQSGEVVRVVGRFPGGVQ